MHADKRRDEKPMSDPSTPATPPATKKEPDHSAFLQKDYELKINYLTAHLTRMWTRFNFFVTIETALSTAIFGAFKDAGGFKSQALYVAVIGAVFSLVWYVVGTQDRYLVEVYREYAKDV